MKRRLKPLLLTITAMLLLSALSYAQDGPSGASSLPSVSPTPVAVSFEDAAKLTLDQLDAAESYVRKLEVEKAVADERLGIEKERTRLQASIIEAKDAQLTANAKEKEAMVAIDAERDKKDKAKDKRIADLEKKKGGSFVKGFGVGFVTGFFAHVFL